MELVFMPSGGVRGVAGVVSIVSGKDGELPLVILDADGSGKSAKNKLQSGLYNHNPDAIIDIGEFLDFDNGEVEDLLPPSLMIRQINLRSLYKKTQNTLQISWASRIMLCVCGKAKQKVVVYEKILEMVMGSII